MILENSRYQLGGVDLLEVANEFGTPVYVYDADTIADKYQQINTAFSAVKLRIK
jgi:diaminopimelate decarboxylase